MTGYTREEALGQELESLRAQQQATASQLAAAEAALEEARTWRAEAEAEALRSALEDFPGDDAVADTQRVSDIIERHGASIAFPTRTLHIQEGPPPEPTEAAGSEKENTR